MAKKIRNLLAEIDKKFKDSEEVSWCQTEEPKQKAFFVCLICWRFYVMNALF